LFLPLRRNEASGLRWSEVWPDRIRISAFRANEHKKAAELPLSPPARAILEARKATATNDLVFPSSNGALVYELGPAAHADSQGYWRGQKRQSFSLLAS
jgi:integrase